MGSEGIEDLGLFKLALVAVVVAMVLIIAITKEGTQKIFDLLHSLSYWG